MKSLLRSSVFKMWQDHETKCLKTVAEGKRAIYIAFNVLSINKMKFVFVNIDYFRACMYIYAKKLIKLHSVFFILLPSCLCPEKRTWKGLFSGNHVCPRFSRPVLTSNVFPIFQSTTKMFLICQHFYVQMHLPIWFSHTSNHKTSSYWVVCNYI